MCRICWGQGFIEGMRLMDGRLVPFISPCGYCDSVDLFVDELERRVQLGEISRDELERILCEHEQ